MKMSLKMTEPNVRVLRCGVQWLAYATTVQEVPGMIPDIMRKRYNSDTRSVYLLKGRQHTDTTEK